VCRHTSPGQDGDQANVDAGEDDITDEEADKPARLLVVVTYKGKCCVNEESTDLYEVVSV
jgi:hypothetical protein